jgi:hypothetical protein
VTRAIRPFFGYYGGKWRDALKHYPAPEHPVIAEPFAGSAGYALRYPDRKVVLCERDPVLAAVWRYLLCVSPQEILAIPDVPENGSVDDLAVPQEAKWLVGFWLNRATTRPRRTPSRWMRDLIRPGCFWGERVRCTIASQLSAIRHWVLHEGDYAAACTISESATWFIDPPYQRAGRHYRFGANQIDYEHLAAWCLSRPGQVIVCENQGADWLPFRSLSDVKTTRPGRRSREVVWLSNVDQKPTPLALARAQAAA